MKLTNQTRFCIVYLHRHSFLTINPQTHGLFRTILDGWQIMILFNKTAFDGLNMLYGYSIFLHPISQRCSFVIFARRKEKDAAFVAYDNFSATKKDYEFFNNQIIGLTTYHSFELQYFYENKD